MNRAVTKFWLAFSALLFGVMPSCAADLDAKAIDGIMEATREFFHVPGIAVVVVHNDRVVYLKGFGERELGKPEKITPDTLFPIASLSKAFTATTAASLVSDGRLTWDATIRQIMPAFRLLDPVADQEVTLRDLLTHRTGLPRHDLIWRQPWSRLELIRRSAFLPSYKPFRSEYQYNTLMYVAAGLTIEQAAGLPWEEVVTQRLLQPLDMKATNFRVEQTEKIPDHARPHWMKEDNTIVRIPFRDLDAMAPAGGINSTARDLGQWLRFQLAKGKWNGKSLIAEKPFCETHKPTIIVPPLSARSIPEEWSIQTSYGLGWNIADYRGHHIVFHSGAIDGFTSFALLAPREKFAVAVLNNLQLSPLPRSVAFQLLDLKTNLGNSEWNTKLQSTKDKLNQLRIDEEKATAALRKPGTKTSLPLQNYTGTYDHPGYGRMHIDEVKGTLFLEYAEERKPLEHFHYDTFLIPPTNDLWPGMYGNGLVTFRLDESGTLASVRFSEQEFAKISDKK